ncbi:MAG: serine/threonine-protein kinase [Pirellulaceae bacterium]
MDQRVDWMIQIASGVQAAHQQLILHRDLKPANVLINNEDQAILTDFGLAKFLEPMMPETSRTTAGKIMGTPQYMSPEQVAAEPATMSTDIYGLGGILYYLLTGKPPFDHATFLETCQAVRDEAIVSPRKIVEGIPRDLETICLKCLARNPEHRYPSVDSLLVDLTAFRDHRPVAARPVSAFEQLGYWARRNVTKAIVSAIAMLIALGSVVTIAVLWQRSSDNARRAKESLEGLQRANASLFDSVALISSSLKVAEQDTATLELQLELLEGITSTWDRLMDLGQLSPEDRRVMGDAWFKKSAVESRLGRRREKLESLETAEAIFQALADEFPDDLRYLFSVFHCQNARSDTKRAFATIEQIYVRDHSRNIDYRDAYAHAAMMRGRGFALAGLLDLARPLLGLAQTLASENLTERPDVAIYWKKRAEVSMSLAWLDLMVGDVLTVGEQIDSSVRDLEKANELMPGDSSILNNAIDACLLDFTLAMTEQDFNRAELALSSADHFHSILAAVQNQSDSFFRTKCQLACHRFYLEYERGDSVQIEAAAEAWRDASFEWVKKRAKQYAPANQLTYCLALQSQLLNSNERDICLEISRTIDLGTFEEIDKPRNWQGFRSDTCVFER